MIADDPKTREDTSKRVEQRRSILKNFIANDHDVAKAAMTQQTLPQMRNLTLVAKEETAEDGPMGKRDVARGTKDQELLCC